MLDIIIQTSSFTLGFIIGKELARFILNYLNKKDKK